MKTLIKICGIKDLAEAGMAIKNGADILGFNLVKTSKRYIEPKVAKNIIKKIDRRKVEIAGVFQNEEKEKDIEITDFLKLDLVQLHGEEEPEIYRRLKTKIIKVFPVERDFDVDKLLLEMKQSKADFYLLDRRNQGSGERIDVEKARRVAEKFSLFLAGGLNPENVKKVVEKVKPYAVDVASGVESDGRKNMVKIQKFIRMVRSIS